MSNWPTRQRVKRKIEHTITVEGIGKFRCSNCGPVNALFDEKMRAMCPVDAYKGKQRTKFGNKPTVIDLPYGKGRRRFDSELEADRAVALCHFENEGYIESLEFQKRIKLVVDGEYVATYVADFTYKIVGYNKPIVEDTKGKETDVFRLKAALYKATTGDEIVIIKRKDVGSRPTRKQ